VRSDIVQETEAEERESRRMNREQRLLKRLTSECTRTSFVSIATLHPRFPPLARRGPLGGAGNGRRMTGLREGSPPAQRVRQ